MTWQVGLLCLLLALPSAAAGGGGSQIASPRSGSPSGPTARPDILWSQPPDMNGSKVSSEVIEANGFESQVADDFILAEDAVIVRLTAYGGYFNWVEGDPGIHALNVSFHEDIGCCPWEPLSFYWHPAGDQFIGYDGWGTPCYRYTFTVDFAAAADVRYWIVVQATDHPFPPQWGRMQAMGERECEAMFRIFGWGYPEWYPVREYVGVPWDAAFELESAAPVATRRESWGAIRGLFRLRQP